MAEEDIEPAPFTIRIDPSTRVREVDPKGYTAAEDRRRHKKKQRKEKPRDEFEEVTAAVALAHERLDAQRLPYRFSVYRRGEEVLVDLLLLNADGSVKEIKVREISRERFEKWIGGIDQSEGLLFDSDG
jgi:hypothetical protein